MPLPIQTAAYTDCYEIWAAAARLRIGCRSYVGPIYAQAEYLRMRLHQARKLLRDQSKRAYPREHPLWGQSEYDAYKVLIKPDDDDHYWIYIESHGNWGAVASIEAIPDEEIPILPPQPAHFPRAIPTQALEAAHEPAYNPEQDDLE
jgi:hypothetical protein